MVFANIGNPQSLRQKPISYFRQVLSILENADDTDTRKALQATFPKDVVERAEKYLEEGVVIGAYSDSAGVRIAREEVAAYISGAPPPPRLNTSP